MSQRGKWGPSNEATAKGLDPHRLPLAALCVALMLITGAASDVNINFYYNWGAVGPVKGSTSWPSGVPGCAQFNLPFSSNLYFNSSAPCTPGVTYSMETYNDSACTTGRTLLSLTKPGDTLSYYNGNWTYLMLQCDAPAVLPTVTFTQSVGGHCDQVSATYYMRNSSTPCNFLFRFEADGTPSNSNGGPYARIVEGSTCPTSGEYNLTLYSPNDSYCSFAAMETWTLNSGTSACTSVCDFSLSYTCAAGSPPFYNPPAMAAPPALCPPSTANNPAPAAPHTPSSSATSICFSTFLTVVAFVGYLM
jgi:hypothetical protein